MTHTLTPFDTVIAETPIPVLVWIVRYINGIRAFQGLAPIAEIRRPSYHLGAAHTIHCPFWVSVFDKPTVTQADVLALEAYLHAFGIVLVLPAWLSAWTRRHTDLWHKQLKESSP